jgi:asparagine synthase (glutamine-hydrolysing)
MAHSLETRVPFMDNDLVDFAMKLPVSLKVKNLQTLRRVNENQQGNKKADYLSKTNDGKYILRKAMSKHTSKNVVERDKQGFSSPDASWFRGESIEFVKKRLGNESDHIYTIFNFEEVQQKLHEHYNGLENRRLFIWSMLHLSELIKN